MEWLATTLLDSVEVSGKLLKFLVASELPNEGVHEFSEEGDKIVG